MRCGAWARGRRAVQCQAHAGGQQSNWILLRAVSSPTGPCPLSTRCRKPHTNVPLGQRPHAFWSPHQPGCEVRSEPSVQRIVRELMAAGARGEGAARMRPDTHALALTAALPMRSWGRHRSTSSPPVSSLSPPPCGFSDRRRPPTKRWPAGQKAQERQVPEGPSLVAEMIWPPGHCILTPFIAVSSLSTPLPCLSSSLIEKPVTERPPGLQRWPGGRGAGHVASDHGRRTTRASSEVQPATIPAAVTPAAARTRRCSRPKSPRRWRSAA